MLANAFFVAVEFALVAVDRTEVELAAAAGDRRAGMIAAALGRLNFHLSGAQLGITATSLGLGFVAEPAIAELLRGPLESWLGTAGTHGLSLVLALAIATIVQMVVGELVPKAIAVGRPFGTARALAPLTAGYVVAMAPVIRLFVGAANRAVRGLGIEPREELTSVRSRAELVRLVHSSAEEGTIEPEEFDLLTRAFRFGEKSAADVLTPRTDVIALASTADGAELTARSVETGFSRFPVFGVDLDDIVGVVHVKSLLEVPPDARGSVTVTELMAEPFVVPEAMPADELLGEMRGQHQYLAVVLDEYGGTAGIATSEDLVEEIVGEIDDEHDPSVPRRASVGTGWVLSGGLHGDEVQEACGFEMPDGEYETLAGFVLDRLGRIPDIGDVVEHDGWRIAVAVKRRHRIVTLVVTPPVNREPATATDAGGDRR